MRIFKVLFVLIGLSGGLPAWTGEVSQAPATIQEPPSGKAEVIQRPKALRPIPSAELDGAIRRGVDFLVKTQNRDGSWGGPALKGGVPIFSDVPGTFRAWDVAVTSLCVEALIEEARTSPQALRALERGEAYLLATLPNVRRDLANANNIWTHAYALQALARMHDRLPGDTERRKKIEDLIHSQLDRLRRHECVIGGWCYYPDELQRTHEGSNSFVNATVLVALDRIRKIGIDLQERMVKRAVQSTAAQRKPDSSYLYIGGANADMHGDSRPMWEINRPSGSLGRSQACNVALRLWGDSKITDEVLKTWLDRLITRNGWLDMGRKKPIPHESFALVAGYFFYYGHYYASLCIGQLPPDQRPFYQDHLAAILMALQEQDGSWWDYPLYDYHKPYGTAFVIMSLQGCRKK